MQRARKPKRPFLRSGFQPAVLPVFPLSVLGLVLALPSSARAQATTPSASGEKRAVIADQGAPITRITSGTRLVGESDPYHLEWNGTGGTLVRRALGAQPEVRLPLYYLHTEPGPKGHSKYLAWFLARDNDRFSVVWAYLNDSGREFYCWLYQYPSNQLTTLRFSGDYRFAPLPEPVAASTLEKLNTLMQPSYNGPDFTYRDWTRRSGTLRSLDLNSAHTESFSAPLNAEDAPPSNRQEDKEKGRQGEGQNATSALQDKTANTEHRASPSGQTPNIQSAPVKTLSQLRVYPMHEIHVAKGNGWREGGWRELHALAYDSANDPYYLILYSNVTQGYVVDLKRAQTFTADFGQKVKFGNDESVFGIKEDVVAGPPDVRIRRFARFEVPLVSAQKLDNAYTDVLLDMEFRGPDGKTVQVPGFWDGGQTWRVRFTPTQIGKWSWRSYSLDPDLDKQVGSFTCVADETGNKGFVTVNTQRFYPHSFASANGIPFFPVFLRDPVGYFPAPAVSSQPGKTTPPPTLLEDVSLMLTPQAALPGAAAPSGPNDPTLLMADTQNMPGTFRAFRQRVDEAAALGFNRFWGGWLLDPVLFPGHAQANEGGAPFVGYSLDQINPAYFQWMDRRIAYCNEHNIVPDIGVTDISAEWAGSLNKGQVSRLWRYALARYASYNVNWNLFGKSADKPFPPDADDWIVSLAKATEKADPVGHPLTTVVPNAAAQAVVPAQPSGPPVIFRPDGTQGDASQPTRPPVVITPDVPSVPRGQANRSGQPNGSRQPNGSSQPGGNGLPNGGTRPGRQPNSPAVGNGQPNADTGGAQRPSSAPAVPGRTDTGRTDGSAAGRPQFPTLPDGTPDFAAIRSMMQQNGAGGFGQGTGGDPRAGGRNGRNGRRGGNRGGLGSMGGSGFGDSGSGSSSDGDITGNTTESDYVTIVDPQVAAAMRADRRGQRGKATFTSVPVVRYGSETWLDVITLAGGDLASLMYDYRFNKPLVVQDITGSAAPDAFRYRLWETVMQGGFWQGATSASGGTAEPLDSRASRWQLACAKLFQRTQYQRLSPHQEMLGGPGESPFERRRRKRAETEAASQGSVSVTAGTSSPTVPNVPNAPNMPKAPAMPVPPGGLNGGADFDFGDDGDMPFDFGGGAPGGSLPGGNSFGQRRPGGRGGAGAKSAAPTIYVLADPGWEYVVYFQNGGAITLDLLEAIGTVRQAWYNPRTGEFASEDTISGGIYKTFTAPDANDWVLLLSRRR